MLCRVMPAVLGVGSMMAEGGLKILALLCAEPSAPSPPPPPAEQMPSFPNPASLLCSLLGSWATSDPAH